MNAPLLTQAILKSLITYDPATGMFRWLPRPGKTAWNTRYAGKPAGFDWTVGGVVYRSIRIFDWPFLGHRLAWLYMTGAWPASGIDHRDGDGLNNRWANLREATKVQNAGNVKAKRRNTSGFKGVSQTPNGRFRASIQSNGNWRHLGTFMTAEEAHSAYIAAAIETFGDFARAG